MKLRTTSAFTLVEMLTVMAVIAILAGLIVQVNAFAHKKAALARAEGEIRTMVAACEAYKGDFGGYPREESVTDDLDPRTDGNSGSEKYQKASLILYKAISGDAKQGVNPEPPATSTDNPDGKPETKGYCEFRPDQLHKNSSGEIKYIQDPFGNSYGYSTAGAKTEEGFRKDLQGDPNASRPKSPKGYSPSFDLWSTGGVINKESDETKLNPDRKRWVKNW